MNCKWYLCKNEVEPGTDRNRKNKVYCSPVCRNRASGKRYRQNLKIRAVEYKGGKCQNCGYFKCIAALEFHHKESLDKDFTISDNSLGWETIKKELEKCDLLCANCHREVHATIPEWTKGLS